MLASCFKNEKKKKMKLNHFKFLGRVGLVFGDLSHKIKFETVINTYRTLFFLRSYLMRIWEHPSGMVTNRCLFIKHDE